MTNDSDLIQYLDNGYVKHVASNGSDELIATFARASFDETAYVDETKNKNLINHLVEKEHTSPIEAGEMVFQFKLPLFVRDQLVRHRTASLNIQSLRYSKHNGEYYVPDLSRFCEQDAWNKQGSGAQIDQTTAAMMAESIDDHSRECYDLYETLIAGGLARETARMVIPTNFFVTMAWKCDTKNLMHFLRLRDDPHAQWEIQKLAQIVSDFFKRDFPMTYAAYEEFIKGATKISASETSILRKLLSKIPDEKIDEECLSIGLSKRRTRELKEYIRGAENE